ncbi:MAG: head-tail connector protein [Acutalibacteraceae bacterium]|nr:head-tail connector protein [Acutalibacteraceae bacterium]
MTVSVKEVKTFLRVDHNEDDTLIRSYIYAAESLCLDIMRTDDRTKLKSEKNAKVAILYAVAYFYEHREEADYKALTLSLRALLFGSRKEEF